MTTDKDQLIAAVLPLPSVRSGNAFRKLHKRLLRVRPNASMTSTSIPLHTTEAVRQRSVTPKSWPEGNAVEADRSAATADGAAPRGPSIDGRPLEDRTAARRRWLRRQNWRLRWTKGNGTLHHHAPHPAHRKIRWDAVRMLLRTRQWRLALTVAAMPCGYALSKVEAKSRV